MEYSNSDFLSSRVDIFDLLNKKTIEIVIGPIYFRTGIGNADTTTFNGKEYASPGEVYQIETIAGYEPGGLQWAKLDDNVYVFIGYGDELLVR